MKLINTWTILLFALVLFACNKPIEYNVVDYGAVGDSLTVNTEAIQKAIDDCNADGGGTVLVPEGNFVSGTILLKDNVNLHLVEHATLIGSRNPLDYHTIDEFVDATGQVRGKCLIGAADATNIAITGKGKVDGRGHLYHHGPFKKTLTELNIDQSEFKKLIANRPFLVRFVRCNEVIMKEVELRQPAAWTLHFFQCANILVDGIEIHSHAHRNNDGIDLDSSHDVVIKNCHINSGDDAICFKTTSPLPTYNVEVNHCKLKSDWGTIKFGTESMGDFKNISISNCKIYDTKGGGIKILSVDGANIDNIRIDSIEMENVDMPLFIRLGERRRTYRGAQQQAVGSIKNVSISNIKAVTRSNEESRINPPSGILLTGTPNHPIENITLKNIDITLPGGGNIEQKTLKVCEDEERYPEFSFFGILPASGMYARHIKTLNLDQVHFNYSSPDARDIIKTEDVEVFNPGMQHSN